MCHGMLSIDTDDFFGSAAPNPVLVRHAGTTTTTESANLAPEIAIPAATESVVQSMAARTLRRGQQKITT